MPPPKDRTRGQRRSRGLVLPAVTALSALGVVLGLTLSNWSAGGPSGATRSRHASVPVRRSDPAAHATSAAQTPAANATTSTTARSSGADGSETVGTSTSIPTTSTSVAAAASGGSSSGPSGTSASGNILISPKTPTATSSPVTPSTTSGASAQISAWWALEQPRWATFYRVAQAIQTDLAAKAYTGAAVTANTAENLVAILQISAPYTTINKPWQEALTAYRQAYKLYETGLNHVSTSAISSGSAQIAKANSDIAEVNVIVAHLIGQSFPVP